MNNTPLQRKYKQRHITLYWAILVILFLASLWVTTSFLMPYLAPGQHISQESEGGLSEAFTVFTQSIQHHVESTMGLLILQIIVILSVARVARWLFIRIKQPAVIGEIVAGILLGPTLLGALAPDLFAWLFPQSSIGNIELLSQFGLILFMFTIGMELRIEDIRSQAKQALVISQSGIFIPFILGLVLSAITYQRYASEVPFFSLALFIGISLSITAFPVLARIIQERNMSQTTLGKLTLNTAAAGDILAWLMLAAIMAITQSGNFTSALFNLLFLVLYMAFALGVLRPLFSMVGRIYNRQELLDKSMVGGIFILLLLSAYLTELLSMHALFGAFIFGLVMPENLKFRHIMTEKVEDVSLNIFLPLFFVSSGLRTELGLLNTVEIWMLLLLFVLAAVVGKIGGTYIAARICNISKKESLYLGSYMNTRGLMELVVLKIGLDMGILPPVIFAILVMMTLITTVMTAPLIHFIDLISNRLKNRSKKADESTAMQRILIAFGRPETGAKLLHLAHSIFPRKRLDQGISLLHVTIMEDLSTINAETFFEENFQPGLQKAKQLSLNVTPIYRATEQVTEEIVAQANNPEHNFLLVGAGLNLSEDEQDKDFISLRKQIKQKWISIPIASTEVLLHARNLFNDKMEQFAKNAHTELGIYVERDPAEISQVLIATADSKEYSDIAPYALEFASHHKATTTVWAPSLHQVDSAITTDDLPKNIKLLPSNSPLELLTQYQFLFISYQLWESLTEKHPETLTLIPSTLIIRTLANKEKPVTRTLKTIFE